MNKIFVTLAVLLCFSAHVDSKGGRGGRGRSRGGGGGGGNKGGGRKGFGGSVSSSNARIAAAALATGYVGYKGGKIARRISYGSSAMYLASYNRRYYLGNRYFTTVGKSSNVEVCKYEISSSDEFFNLTYADDGSRVTEVVYECSSKQYCCDGLDCCNEELPRWALDLLIVGGVALFTGCCICCVYNHQLEQTMSVADNVENKEQPTIPSYEEYLQHDMNSENPVQQQQVQTDPLLPTYAQSNMQNNLQDSQLPQNISYASYYASNSDQQVPLTSNCD